MIASLGPNLLVILSFSFLRKKTALPCYPLEGGAGRISNLWCLRCHFLREAPFGESGWVFSVFCLFSRSKHHFQAVHPVLGTDNVAQRANCKLERAEGHQTPSTWCRLRESCFGAAVHLLHDLGPITGPQFPYQLPRGKEARLQS